ncbi:hypothetical protein BU17DRAFT_65792 [Hysterangium stoloniferum]|nr:hypothetical protein BU17DRAFT_65792 [Hysterangium stoloniferum]
MISLWDIVLVTGYDRTSSWAAAVFSGSAFRFGINLDIQTGIAKATVLGEISKETHLEAMNSGPLGRRVRTGGDRDQCVFDNDGDDGHNGGGGGNGHNGGGGGGNGHNDGGGGNGHNGGGGGNGHNGGGDGNGHNGGGDGNGYNGGGGDGNGYNGGDGGGNESRQFIQPPYDSESTSNSESSGSSRGSSTAGASFAKHSDDYVSQSSYPPDDIVPLCKEGSVLDQKMKSDADFALVHDDDFIHLKITPEATDTIQGFENYLYGVSPKVFVEDGIGMLEFTYHPRLSITLDDILHGDVMSNTIRKAGRTPDSEKSYQLEHFPTPCALQALQHTERNPDSADERGSGRNIYMTDGYYPSPPLSNQSSQGGAWSGSGRNIYMTDGYYPSPPLSNQSSRGSAWSGSGRNLYMSSSYTSSLNSRAGSRSRSDSDNSNLNDNYLPPTRDILPAHFAYTPDAVPPTQEPFSGRFVQYTSDVTPQISSDHPGFPTRTTRYDDPSRKYPCDECGKSFLTPSALQTHQNTHTGAKRASNIILQGILSKAYSFSYLAMTFSVKSNQRRHEQSVHSGDPAPENQPYYLHPIREALPEYFPNLQHATPPTGPQEPPSGRFVQYASDMTPQRSSDRLGVPKKTTRYDDPRRKFSCDECGKKFPTPNALYTHQNTHTAKPFVCSKCGKSFSVKSNLRRHEQSVHSVVPAADDKGNDGRS